MNRSVSIKLFARILPGENSSLSDQIPHCPNPGCKNFRNPPSDSKWYMHYGWYQTKIRGKVRRLRCKTCDTTFSPMAFHIDHFAKRTVDYVAVLTHLVSSSGNANTCRILGIRDSTLSNRVRRLSRVCQAIHSQVRRELGCGQSEAAFVLDGFESFCQSQYHPNNINIVVGSGHEFIYQAGLSVLKRKGRMSAKQKATRDRLEKEHPTNSKETEHSVANLLQDIGVHANGRTGIPLFTDEHKTYPRSLATADPQGDTFVHYQISSKEPRGRYNPLFPVNYADRQFRKDLANHVRETVQFARSPVAMMSRLALYLFYHNYLSPYRVRRFRKGDWSTRAEMMSIGEDRLKEIVAQHWGRRTFEKKTELWSAEKKTWEMGWRNPGEKFGQYVPKYIAA